MKKVTVIGHYGFGCSCLDGQTVKTKILTEELERVFGTEQVDKLDTHGGMKKMFRMPILLWRILRRSENVIILPAQNGVRVIAPLLAIENTFFHRGLHYAVIGGWLPEFLKKHCILARFLHSFSGIYVETTTMKNALEKQGFSNIYVMPNCKKLRILEESELVYNISEPLRLCTFSRVMKEKGIEDAVEAVKAVNDQFSKTVYTLDIYGQVDQQQTEWFTELQKDFPDYVKYGGSVPYDKSVDVLKDYFALLFPTRFYTEGIPGTIIDAYAAGVPVISAKWESFYDVVDEGLSGIGYAFGCKKDLIVKLLYIAENPKDISLLKKFCLSKSKQFDAKIAVKAIRI